MLCLWNMLYRSALLGNQRIVYGVLVITPDRDGVGRWFYFRTWVWVRPTLQKPFHVLNYSVSRHLYLIPAVPSDFLDHYFPYKSFNSAPYLYSDGFLSFPAAFIFPSWDFHVLFDFIFGCRRLQFLWSLESSVRPIGWIPSKGFALKGCYGCLVLPEDYWSRLSIHIVLGGFLRCWFRRRHKRVMNFCRLRTFWWRGLLWSYRIFTKDIVRSGIRLSNFPNGHRSMPHFSY